MTNRKEKGKEKRNQKLPFRPLDWAAIANTRTAIVRIGVGPRATNHHFATNRNSRVVNSNKRFVEIQMPQMHCPHSIRAVNGLGVAKEFAGESAVFICGIVVR